MKNTKYERLIKIINQDTIMPQEVTEATKLLVGFNTDELKIEDYKAIEEFIVVTNMTTKTQEEFDTLTNIIDFIRGEE